MLGKAINDVIKEENMEKELDEIMEDLIVGHNFEYARKALLEWRKNEILKTRIEISDSIKRQREHYKADSLFSVEYQEGMSDAATIAYDADKHGSKNDDVPQTNGDLVKGAK